MKYGFVRVGATSPEIRVCDVSHNCDECIGEATRAHNLGIKVLAFPELTLSSATAADMFFQRTLLVACERELERFMAQTAQLDLVSVIGLPALIGNKVYNAAAVVSRGVLLGMVPKCNLTPDERRYFADAPSENIEITYAGYDTLLGTDVLFACENVPSLNIAVSIGADISAPLSLARYHATSGATLIVNPTAYPEIVGVEKKNRARVLSDSETLICAMLTASAGEGESGTDAIYGGACSIAECGRMLAASEPFSEDTLVYSECDLDLILNERLHNPAFECECSAQYDYISFITESVDTPLSRKVDKMPFVPEDEAELSERLDLIFNIQARALAARIKRSYSRGAVVGISGGLDSTLALLVSAEAVRLLGLDKSALVAVTMPGFGTTARTKSNAERLSDSLGAHLMCVDIKAAVEQHFKDISHDINDLSVVYENAQARERTQILMDIANKHGALVVGTGDLSELALGWATYNGDHMSMYGVNAGLPKTLMRYMVESRARAFEASGDTESAGILRDVLATPVSPELLPPKDGEIAQCTEGIVGPYELHDFFLYNIVRRGFSPDKVLMLAQYAFEGEYDRETIHGWLTVFVRRFFSQQFKRSALPDGPAVGSVSFSPRSSFRMPSDAISNEWIAKIEK